jgi:hypothetical protein
MKSETGLGIATLFSPAGQIQKVPGPPVVLVKALRFTR